MSFLDSLLRVPPGRFEDPLSFRSAWRARSEGSSPIDAALVGGAMADRLGYAFLAGYTSAVRRLVGLPQGVAGCLVASEARGAHPSAIETTLTPSGRGMTLSGEKRWATLAGEGDCLLVLAAMAPDAGPRKDLRLVRVPAKAPGVRTERMPAAPFAPEIPHYRVRLDEVAVREESILPGDGWSDWVRPFRTLEDTHVAGAAAAWLLAVARREGWPVDLVGRLAATLIALRWLALEDPSAPEVQVALSGALAQLDGLIADTGPWWDAGDPELAARWRRDAPLLHIADHARAERLARATERLPR